MNSPLIVSRIGDLYPDCPDRVDETKLLREKHLQSFQINRIYENTKKQSKFFQTCAKLVIIGLCIGLFSSTVIFILRKLCKLCYKRYVTKLEDHQGPEVDNSGKALELLQVSLIIFNHSSRYINR